MTATSSNLSKYSILDDFEVPDDVLESWQITADLLAEIADIPAALIMRAHDHEIEVFVSSRSSSSSNVYQTGNDIVLRTTFKLAEWRNVRHHLHTG